MAQESPICDVLGPTQRRWLQYELSSSQAPLRIIASGSVPFGSVGFRGDQGECSGDDWQVWIVEGDVWGTGWCESGMEGEGPMGLRLCD